MMYIPPFSRKTIDDTIPASVKDKLYFYLFIILLQKERNFFC